MTSSFFALNYQDAIKGIAIAVIAVILGALQQALTAHGLDISAYDWQGIGTLAIGAAVSYLAKNFLSDSQGNVLGAFGGK